MNEHSFVRSVHRQLHYASCGIHVWKISARFANGVPDAWYSGPRSDLWVEYKWRPRTPCRPFKPGLSKNQRLWFRRRYDEGRDVAVIVGCPAGGLILRDKEWDGAVRPKSWLHTKEIAKWIATHCS